MPAERTRSLKKEKEEVDAIQLTWTDPVKSLDVPQQFAFAPAVTPGTFAEEPSVEGTDLPPSLFPSTQDCAGPRKPGHGKKKGDDYIPRPPNAFILFRSSFIKSRHVSTEVETNHSTLSKIIGLTWQNMPHEERQIWHTKAKVAQAEHKRKFPDYAFRPTHVKSKCTNEKRKVREVGPKDMKRCAKIAQYLVEGKKGVDLEAAMEEFDKSHIPTVVTRFDTPITARSFRRSLSEPAPDTDPSAPAFLRTDPRPSSRHLRASSSQPTLSRPSSPIDAEESVIGSSPSSVFCSSPFANIVDTPGDSVWNDMPPLVLPPVSSTDDAFVTNKPSLDLSTFVFNEAPAACIQSPVDPLSPPPTAGLYSPFSAETRAVSCAPGSFASPLEIDLSFLESWSSSPFPSSPCTPVSYSAGQFSPTEAVPAPPAEVFDPSYNMAAHFDSCDAVKFGHAQEGLGSDPLIHVPHSMDHYPHSTSKGSIHQFFNHEFTMPEVANMNVAGSADMFAPIPQVFSF